MKASLTHAAPFAEPLIVPITPSADAPTAMSSGVAMEDRTLCVLLDEAGGVAHERVLMHNKSLQEFDWSI